MRRVRQRTAEGEPTPERGKPREVAQSVRVFSCGCIPDVGLPLRHSWREPTCRAQPCLLSTYITRTHNKSVVNWGESQGAWQSDGNQQDMPDSNADQSRVMKQFEI